jgi:hypothetical protein
MKMIEKQKSRSKAYKDKSARRKGPKTIVREFIDDMEELRIEAGDSAVIFDEGLNRNATLLESRLMAIDPGVHVQVHWNQEHKVEDWKDLRVEAVTITWSSFYLGKHPFNSKQTHIDVGALWMEGYLES